MINIRVHGRGGQGVITAAEIIAIAAFNDGLEAQAIPSFGVERTGAPVMAFARISKKIIKNKEHIYEPDILIIQDPTLLKVKSVFAGVKPSTIYIVNSPKKINKPNYFTIDATKIALEVIGKNVVNTALLGALIKNTKIISLEATKSAIKTKFAEKGKEIIEKNITTIIKTYEQA